MGLFLSFVCGWWISVFGDDAESEVFKSFEGGWTVEDARHGFVPSFFEMFGEAVFRDEAVRGEDSGVEVLFGTGWERGRVWDGFDFYIFFARDPVFTEFDFCAQKFQGSFDSGGETFHLEETELLVNELVDERDLCRGDGIKLFQVVGKDGEGEIVVMDEAIEILEAVEEVLHGVRGRTNFVSMGARSGGALSIGAVGCQSEELEVSFLVRKLAGW